jgi:hypothetical protein
MSESAAVRHLAGGPDRGHVRRAVTGRSLNVALANSDRTRLPGSAGPLRRLLCRARAPTRTHSGPGPVPSVSFFSVRGFGSMRCAWLLVTGAGARPRRSGWLRPPRVGRPAAADA